MHLKKLCLLALPLVLAACTPAPVVPSDTAASSSAAAVTSSAEAVSSSAVSNGQLPLSQRSVKYTNTKLGFSLLVPTYMGRQFQCDYSPPPPDNRYPVKVVEDGDIVYITPAKYAYLRYNDENDQNPVCTNVDVTLETLRADVMMEDYKPLWYYYGWRMISKKNIQSDADLLAFIQEWYGPGCTIRSKTETAQTGTFDVAIEPDPADPMMETLSCVTNFLYAVKYSPARQQVVTWKIGQDGRFENMDMDMIASFRFE
jgi:hypothetical protein